MKLTAWYAYQMFRELHRKANNLTHQVQGRLQDDLAYDPPCHPRAVCSFMLRYKHLADL